MTTKLTVPDALNNRILEACMNNLVSVLALPAVWTGGDERQIAVTLLEMLQRMLGLDFAYARLPEAGIEEARFADSRYSVGKTAELGRSLAPLLDDLADTSAATAPGTVALDGISIRFMKLGLRDGTGWLAFGSCRQGFPDRSEELLLGVASNQATLDLQEVRILKEQRERTAELELMVRQRTEELSSSNAALREEARIRQLTEDALLRSEAHLSEAQALSKTGSFVWDVHTGNTQWSAETYRIWELPPSCEPSFDLVVKQIHPDDLPGFWKVFNESVRDAKDSNAEFRLLLPGNRIKFVQLVRRAVTDAAGRLFQFTGAIRDVTETRVAFQEIQDLKDRLLRENVILRDQVDEARSSGKIIGAAPDFQVVLGRVAKVAPTDSTVLITGETGTGKELIARAIHENSKRRSAPFLKINCAAIPTTLIAAELFGYEKGAFTGAVQRKIGRFELANGGTLFLDEVGELPAETQITLLRVLQEREFERVGGTQVIRTDVRIIAATNRDLGAEMVSAHFRRDLFYRLNVFPINMPALRERKEDIALLTEHFIRHYAAKMSKTISGMDKNTLQLFQNYSWPGNIRELQNVIERSLILCDSEKFSVDESWLITETATAATDHLKLGRQPVDKECLLIEQALAETHGRVSGTHGAAIKLGIPASTLESRIRALKINKHRFRTT